MEKKIKKITKREYFTMLMELDSVQERPELVAFIEHEMELLARKNTSNGEKKPTAVQVANMALKEAMYEEMEENRVYTVSEMIKTLPSCEGLSTSKVSAMLTQMEKAGNVSKTVEKRKSYFCKVIGE